MTDAWDPATYDRFKSERTQPFVDLLDLVEPGPSTERSISAAVPVS